MKKLLFVAVLVTAFSLANAQSFKIGGGIDLAVPVSNMGGTSIGAGADLLGHIGISENLGITIDAGYTSFFAKNNGSNYGLIPIRGGIRFMATPQVYLGAKAGVGILTGGSSNTTTTAYSFGGGYMLDQKLDLGLSYDGYSKNGSFGYLNLRLGYFFGN